MVEIPMRYYKWMADGKPIYGRGTYAPPGEWQPRIEGELMPCKNGYHILTAEQVPYWCGTELIEVKVRGVEVTQEDKCVCRTWREVKRYRWSRDDMVAYAQWCASRTKKYAAANAAAAAEAAAAAAARDAAAARAADAAASAAAFAVDAAACSAFHAASSARNAARAAAEVDERAAQRMWIEERIGKKLCE